MKGEKKRDKGKKGKQTERYKKPYSVVIQCRSSQLDNN